MPVFSEQETPIRPEQILALEDLIGLTFPQQYKQHLLANNGGRCEPSTFNFTENGSVALSSVDRFLAIHDGEHDNLATYVQWYKLDSKRLPQHMIPVAHDPGGNLICLSCGGMDTGQVFFWDHENEVDYSISDDRDYSNLYLIANTFNEFLDGLFEDVE